MGNRIDPRHDLALMEGYHSPQVAVDVRLNTNESPYPPPRSFVDALAEEVRRIPLHRYPDRTALELRGALGASHGQPAARVFVANGSNEVLQTLCLTYGGTGRAVAVFEPTYALHSHIARISGASVVEGARRDDFTLDLDEVRRVLEGTGPAITFLCSPNNPTGRVEPREVVKAVLDAAPGIVVVDEAYGQFASWSAMELVDDDTPLVVVRTYSKTWSMAALRLGYCIAPPWIVEALHKVVLPYHVDAVKQAAGRLALQYQSEMEGRVALLVDERERVAAALRELPVETWPSGANFVLFRPVDRDGDEVWHALVERSVLVRNTASWPRLRGCLRVTIGTPEEDDAFLAALKEVLA